MTIQTQRNALMPAQADYFLTDMRAGTISRAIHKPKSENVIYVLKTQENELYCALINARQYPDRNALLLLSLRLGLPTTISAEPDRSVDTISVGLRNTQASQALHRNWALLDDVRTGLIVQIDDANILGSFGYILRSPDGAHYCAQMNPAEHSNRHKLLMMAFKSGLPVTISGSPDYYVTGVSVGSRKFGPNIDYTPIALKNTPRTGYIEEIIDSNLTNGLSVILKTADGTRYHARVDQTRHPERNRLITMALGFGLPITLYANDQHYITGFSIGTFPAENTPPLICFSLRLTEMRSGFIIRIIDYDALDRVNYLLRAWDGGQYCIQMDASKFPHRHRMLTHAMAWGLPVSISADVRSVITGIAIGLPRAGNPNFHCGAKHVAGNRRGNIVRLIDSNAWGDEPNYVLETPDGHEWCVPALTWAHPNRSDLLDMALRSGLSVTADAVDRARETGSLSVERT